MQFKSFLKKYAKYRDESPVPPAGVSPHSTAFKELQKALQESHKAARRVIMRAGCRPEDARPFVFHEPVSSMLEVSERDLPLHVDLPFKDCFFEVAGMPAMWASEHDDGGTRAFRGIYAHEKVPGEYVFGVELLTGTLVAGGFRELISELLLVDSEFTGAEGDDFYGFLKRLVQSYCERLQAAHRYEEKVSTSVKVGDGRASRHINITSVTHVRDQKFTSAVGPFGGKLTYRVDVCGHWRRIAGLGKDRAGERTVSGATWVLPFVRGPKDAPLIVKPREVHRKGVDGTL